MWREAARQSHPHRSRKGRRVHLHRHDQFLPELAVRSRVENRTLAGEEMSEIRVTFTKTLVEAAGIGLCGACSSKVPPCARPALVRCMKRSIDSTNQASYGGKRLPDPHLQAQPAAAAPWPFSRVKRNGYPGGPKPVSVRGGKSKKQKTLLFFLISCLRPPVETVQPRVVENTFSLSTWREARWP